MGSRPCYLKKQAKAVTLNDYDGHYYLQTPDLNILTTNQKQQDNTTRQNSIRAPVFSGGLCLSIN